MDMLLSVPAPITPPTGKPIRELKSPNHADAIFWMLVSRESVVFQQNSPIKRGQKYSDLVGASQSVIDQYPGGLWLADEIVPLRSSEVGNMPGDHFVIWVFSSDRLAQSSTNAGVTYSGESVSHPVYQRDYVIRRDVWEASQSIASLAALTALVGVTITAGGTGYTTATGAVGTATVAFVCSGGALISGIVTKEGSGISSGAAITITGDGTGATATTVIQPATAVLVAQNKQELSADSNLSKEFVLVRRVYETLPGPWLYDTREDLLLGSVQQKRRAVAVTTPPQTAAYSATGKTTYEAREGSAIVAWEIVETFSDGTGSAGNPAYQILDEDIYDKPRGPIQRRTQIVVRSAGPGYTEVASLTEAGGTATLTEYVPYEGNPYLLKKTVETWAIPGAAVPEEKPNEDGTTTVTTRTLALTSAITEGEAIAGGFWTLTRSEGYSVSFSWKVTEVRPIPGNPVVSVPVIDEYGLSNTTTTTLKATSTITEGEANVAGVYTKTVSKPITSLVAEEEVTTRTILSQVISGARVSQAVRNQSLRVTKQKVPVGTAPDFTSLVVSSEVVPINSIEAEKITVSMQVFPSTPTLYEARYVDIPKRVFALPYQVYCNGTADAVIAFHPAIIPGGSFMRQIRITTTYSTAPAAGATFNVIRRANLDHDGKLIHHHFHGVVNDAITFSEELTLGGCTWIESYQFRASSPSATSFGGQWWLIGRVTEEFGLRLYKTTTTEFYEPPITASSYFVSGSDKPAYITKQYYDWLQGLASGNPYTPFVPYTPP